MIHFSVQLQPCHLYNGPHDAFLCVCSSVMLNMGIVQCINVICRNETSWFFFSYGMVPSVIKRVVELLSAKKPNALPVSLAVCMRP